MQLCRKCSRAGVRSRPATEFGRSEARGRSYVGVAAARQQADVLSPVKDGPDTQYVPRTLHIDLTPLYQEFEPKPRAVLPSFDPLFRVFRGEEVPNDKKKDVIHQFMGLGETQPRIVSPMLPRALDAAPSASLPLLYYLPGIDGTGLAAYRQFPTLAKGFDVRALVLPPDSRSSFQDILAVVQEHIRYEVSRSPPNRPVYLLGESFGGLCCLALAVMCKDIVDRVILVNPASSFTRTPWGSMGALLTSLPPELYRLLPFALAPLLTNPAALAMHDVDTKLSPLEQASDFAFGLVGLLPELTHLKLALPPATLSFRLKLLTQGCEETAPLLHKVPQRVLLLAGQLDLLIPSWEESQRLQRILPRATSRLLEGRTHALLQEAGVDLLEIMQEEGFYCATRRLSSDPTNTHPGSTGLHRSGGPADNHINGAASSSIASNGRHAAASSRAGMRSTAVGSNIGAPFNSPTSKGIKATGVSNNVPYDGTSNDFTATTPDSFVAPDSFINSPTSKFGPSISNGAYSPNRSAPTGPGAKYSTSSSDASIPSSSTSFSAPQSVYSSGEESDMEDGAAVTTVTSVTIASRSGISSLQASLDDVAPGGPNLSMDTDTVVLDSWDDSDKNGSSNAGTNGRPSSRRSLLTSSRATNKKAKRKSSANYGSAGPIEVPNLREVDLMFERSGLALFKRAVSPVYFSTDASGRVEAGLGAIPEVRPLLFVGNHQLLDPSLPLMIEQFLKERGIMLRGLAHPAVSKPRQEQVAIDFGVMNMGLRTMTEATGGNGFGGQPGVVNFMTTWGAVPVGPKNLYALLQQGEAVLLYPGGVREAYKLKNERYKLIWPERSEFVRMAARLGATIVPFAAVGGEDGYNLLLDSSEVSRLPLVGDWLVEQARRLPSARNGVNFDKELEDLFVQPVLFPGLPSRFYFKFCKPIFTTPEMADDKDECDAIYKLAKKEVNDGLGWLLRKREADQYKDLLPRLAYEAAHDGLPAPTFLLD